MFLNLFVVSVKFTVPRAISATLGVYVVLRFEMFPNAPVPVEDHVVPTHASHSNKMNNMIGNVNSSQGVGPGLLEVVVPSDYYVKNKMPTEQTRRYWPSGSILPDYIFDY